MSRRSGQTPQPKLKNGWWTVLFRIDIPGQCKRASKRVRICPANDGTSMSEIQRKAKEIIQTSGADTVEHFEKCEAVTNGESFKQVAAAWLSHAETRSRKPIKPATAAGYQSYLTKWLNPYIGDMPLAQVDNGSVKSLIEKLKAADLKPKTIVEIVGVAKWVVASAIDTNGKQKFPREWNHDFMDLPVVESDKQDRPTVDAEHVAACIQKATSERYRTLYALLAGTGLRIGEALAIHIEDGNHTTISPDCKTIHVRTSIWQGTEQEPKTPAAKRSIDLCDELAAYLRAFIGDRKKGLVFETVSGKPLAQSNILRSSLSGLGVEGFHCFRRYRDAHLVESDCPDDLKKFWIGHATKGVSELYGKQTTKNLRRRQEWAAKIGLGFNLVASQCIPEPVASAA